MWLLFVRQSTVLLKQRKEFGKLKTSLVKKDEGRNQSEPI